MENGKTGNREQKTGGWYAQCEEEHERIVVVVSGRGDDRRRDERADEGGRLPDHGEEREEEEPARGPPRRVSLGHLEVDRDGCVHLWQRGDLADHGLAVGVPRTHHQSIVGLVQPGRTGT